MVQVVQRQRGYMHVRHRGAGGWVTADAELHRTGLALLRLRLVVVVMKSIPRVPFCSPSIPIPATTGEKSCCMDSGRGRGWFLEKLSRRKVGSFSICSSLNSLLANE